MTLQYTISEIMMTLNTQKHGLSHWEGSKKEICVHLFLFSSCQTSIRYIYLMIKTGGDLFSTLRDLGGAEKKAEELSCQI